MARLRATSLLLCLSGLLLAGCSSPDDRADGPAVASPAGDHPDPGAEGDAGAEDAAAPGGQQRESLGWLVSGIACAHAGPTQDAIHASLRPELEGITFSSAPVDPATIGQPWNATVSDAATLVGFEVTFWKGAVGPGGEAIAFVVGLPRLDGDATVGGEVPEGAGFVSAFACSGEPGSVEYAAALPGLQPALL